MQIVVPPETAFGGFAGRRCVDEKLMTPVRYQQGSRDSLVRHLVVNLDN